MRGHRSPMNRGRCHCSPFRPALGRGASDSPPTMMPAVIRQITTSRHRGERHKYDGWHHVSVMPENVELISVNPLRRVRFPRERDNSPPAPRSRGAARTPRHGHRARRPPRVAAAPAVPRSPPATPHGTSVKDRVNFGELSQHGINTMKKSISSAAKRFGHCRSSRDLCKWHLTRKACD
jgi:hypothetical protein